MTDHLWEHDHPYYCTEGNFYRTGHHDLFESWQQFKEHGMYDVDRDLNLLFRWDWKAWHLDPDADPGLDESGHELLLYFVLQRKAILRSASVRVTDDDEPEVRAWLTECAKTVAAIWDPLLTANRDDA